ncbi:MAG: protein translocase subunit SecD [Rickettsiales bacterium]|nr:MAG: protein translocase subunit SecD [Rickettsiales bacterium]
MQKISKWKMMIAILVTITSIIYVTPNFTTTKSSWLPEDTVNLGLDLRGGAHLLLRVDFDKYMDDVSQSVAESLRKNLRSDKIRYRNLHVSRNKIQFDLRNLDDQAKINKLARTIDANLSAVKEEGKITLFYDEYAINQLQDKVIDQSIEIIRMRVDSTGTKEPSIQRQGTQDILLQVPGEDNPAELQRVLGQTAKLTFHLVDEGANLERARSGHAPTGSMILKSGDDQEGVLVVKKKIIVQGDQLNNAQAQFQEGEPVVHFSFNHLGAKKFAEATTKNRGRRLAIVLDGKILSAPVINGPITGGEGVVSGNFTVEAATELALMLRAGALPAPLSVIEKRTIGPNLGADSIESGKMASIVAFGLVVLFMLLSYGILGLFANITLVLALLYIFAVLTMLQATLTLPGIAGIILTIGMAVDANVLIYERIKEESAKGCSNLYAVKVGFESAFATIMDSNVTTLIAAFLLYTFGVGAIKGFAVTLTIGILASMYTALVITKLMIDIWLKLCNPKSLGF